MSKAIIFDTETTGIVDPEIIEAAWIEPMFFKYLTYDKIVDSFLGRYKPSKSISLSAMSVHHIMDEDLVECPPSSTFNLPDDIDYLIGHNVDFDWSAAGKPVVNRICTLALSRHLWPELDSHSQSAMLYFLERESARDGLRGKAHSALHDVKNCLIILSHIVGKLGGVESWEELWKHSEIARIPTIMPFGKHKGAPIKEIPHDYKRWLLNQPDIDQYLLKALQS
jgi:exodeoxyribonuclease X